MAKRFEQIYGYLNVAGVPKKVAKITGKKAADGYLLDLSVIQYDASGLMHFSLHNTEQDGKPTRYHIQTECPDLFTPEDKMKFPEILESPLPDFRALTTIHSLQAVPIHAKADDEIDFYPTMTQSQLARFADKLADFRGFTYDRRTPGLMEFYLVPARATATLDRFHQRISERHGNRLRLWAVCRDAMPWVLCYVMQGETVRKPEECPTSACTGPRSARR